MKNLLIACVFVFLASVCFLAMYILVNPELGAKKQAEEKILIQSTQVYTLDGWETQCNSTKIIGLYASFPAYLRKLPQGRHGLHEIRINLIEPGTRKIFYFQKIPDNL